MTCGNLEPCGPTPRLPRLEVLHGLRGGGAPTTVETVMFPAAFGNDPNEATSIHCT